MSDTLEDVRHMIHDEVGVAMSSLDADMPLDDIPGWDSVAFAGVIIAIEAKFGVVATREQIDAIATVGDLAALCS